MELYNENEPIQAQNISLNSVLTSTFFRMFLGLLASAIAAYYTYSSGLFIKILASSGYTILAVIEIAVVLIFSLLFKKLSPTAVTVLYFAYAFLNGFTLSVIFVVYQMTSIVYAFAGTAVLFGVLAFIGKTTDKDLSNWGTYLIIALFIGIVLTIINFFIGSSMLNIVLDWAILFIFFGLTVYDTNKIKNMYESGVMDNEKLYVYGAMELYLDFINIFLRILSIFGKRRN